MMQKRVSQMGMATALCCAVSAPADADPRAKVTEIWERYVNVCGSAMHDANAFISNLPSWAPAGSFGTMTSPDGKLYKVNIAAGHYFDGYERMLHPKRANENCASHYIGPGVEDAAAIAAALEALVRPLVGSENVIGGNYPELYQESQPNGRLKVNKDNYQYVIAGGLPQAELFTSVQIVSGFISLYTGRPLQGGQ